MRDEWKIDAIKIGYDRALAGYWVDEMTANGFDMEAVAQGPYTWSQPMREMGVALEAKIIPNPAAVAILDVDERDRLTRLRAVVEEVLAELPENLRKVIVGKYWHDEKGSSKNHSAALQQLRHPRMSKRLRGYLWGRFVPLAFSLYAIQYQHTL